MSENSDIHHSFDLILHSSSPNEQIILVDLSPGDKPWDKHRRNADVIGRYYKEGGQGERI